MGTGAPTPSPSWPRGNSLKEPGAPVESYKARWTSRGGWQVCRPPRRSGPSSVRLAAWQAGLRAPRCDCMGTGCGHGGCSGPPRRRGRPPRSPSPAGATSACPAAPSCSWCRGQCCDGAGTSACAIALALALYGIERRPPPEVRRRTSPFARIGDRAVTGWVTLGRWAEAVRGHRLFPQVRPCPASFTRRQVAERAATTLGSRAPPPMDAPLVTRAFNGAAHAP